MDNVLSLGIMPLVHVINLLVPEWRMRRVYKIKTDQSTLFGSVCQQLPTHSNSTGGAKTRK
jgi:hypothetical protein